MLDSFGCLLENSRLVFIMSYTMIISSLDNFLGIYSFRCIRSFKGSATAFIGDSVVFKDYNSKYK